MTESARTPAFRPTPLPPSAALQHPQWHIFCAQDIETPLPYMPPLSPDGIDPLTPLGDHRGGVFARMQRQAMAANLGPHPQAPKNSLSPAKNTPGQAEPLFATSAPAAQNMPDYERVVRKYERRDAQILAMHQLAQLGNIKSYRPILFWALALMGRAELIFGATLLEHLIMPGQPQNPGTISDDSNPEPFPDPSIFGPVKLSNVSIMGGTVLLGAGLVKSLAGAFFFWREARKLSATRANTLACMHVFSLLLTAAHNFLYEWLLYNRSHRDQLYATIPNIISNMIYCYTVPNSFTAAEMTLGVTPLSMKARREVGLVLLMCATGLFLGLVPLNDDKSIPSYAKQAELIGATVCVTLAAGLFIGEARINQRKIERGQRILDEEKRVAQERKTSSTGQNSTIRPPPLPPLDDVRAALMLGRSRPPLRQRRQTISESQTYILQDLSPASGEQPVATRPHTYAAATPEAPATDLQKDVMEPEDYLNFKRPESNSRGHFVV